MAFVTASSADCFRSAGEISTPAAVISKKEEVPTAKVASASVSSQGTALAVGGVRFSTAALVSPRGLAASTEATEGRSKGLLGRAEKTGTTEGTSVEGVTSVGLASGEGRFGRPATVSLRGQS